jgi:excinuclease ABC subunit B
VEPFVVKSDFQPAGDQPEAVAALAAGLERGDRFQTLRGITGSGKSATMAWVIEKVQRPALVLAPNKALGAQLANEFREFFPNNRVEYFVSYYDYYQPEAYIPQSDTYIEKESTVNDEIDRLRHSATAALLTRRDVIIVASVSAIYGLGSPEQYEGQLLRVVAGVEYPMQHAVRRLVDIQYERNEVNLIRGKFRVKGDTLEIFPSYEEFIYRVEYFGDEVERILRMNPVTGEVLDEQHELFVYPATHYVTGRDRMLRALAGIEVELAERLGELEARGGFLQRHRELLAFPRRQGGGGAALLPARLLPGRLSDHHRRVARFDSPDPRPVRRGSKPQRHARRARFSAPVRPGQSAAHFRRME